MFFLRLFGGVSIEGPTGVVTGKASRRHPLAVLALLALSPSRRLARDKIIGCLWPESSSPDARNLLNQAIHALRKVLGADAIRSQADELVLNPDRVSCDVWSFEDEEAAGDPRRAVDLYEGPFADGFYLSDSAEFERWVDGERERLHRAYARALEGLGERATAQGDLQAASEWWRRLVAEEPYSARATVRFMETLELAGDHAAALREAEAHADRLREDLEAEPNPAVLALAERIRTQPVGPAPASREAGPGSRSHRSTGEEPVETRQGRRRSWGRAGILAVGLALLIVLGWTMQRVVGRSGPEVRRLAVLPLANLTGDPEQEYFVSGMHDALITELGRVGSLTVISRQSVARYRGSEEPLPAIAHALGVEALVEGSVFLAGDSVRITAQLVRVDPEEHLWAGNYYGELRNALGLQGEVARAIAEAVRAKLTPAAEARRASRRAVDPAAQEEYLRGLFVIEQLASAALTMADTEWLETQRRAIAHLESAVALEPEWPAAHAKLAFAYARLAGGAGDPDTRLAAGSAIEAESYAKAKAAARRALSLDDTEAQAHASLGYVLLHDERDWTGAEHEFRRALELEPNANNHWMYAIFLRAAGRYDEAIDHYRRAEELNPLAELVRFQVARAFTCAGRHEEAIAQYVELSQRHEVDLAALRRYLGLEYVALARFEEALPALEASVVLSDSAPAAVSGLAYAYARAGRREEARALVRWLEERWDDWPWAALAYAGLGEMDRAVARFETELRRRITPLVHVRCWPSYQALRSEPRVRELVQRIGFPN